MERISPVAWVFIIIFILFIISLNYGLVVILRDRPTLKMPRPRGNHSAETFRKVTEVMRNPFAEEQSQLNQLSNLVEGLKKPAAGGPEDTDEPL